MNGTDPPTRFRFPSSVGSAVLIWAVLMSPLLFWGLPSTTNDDLLFGREPAWEPARYGVDAALHERQQRHAGADTDLNPLTNVNELHDLTDTDAERAEILRRYRLYSRQPDEMIIFQSLQRMQPREGDFDPRLYQYGGGYIYLIGAALGASSALKFTHLTGDAEYYLAHPVAFAHFYVVARFVSLVFGAFTLIAVHRLARRAAGRTAGWIALLAFMLSPIFMVGVVEAKPHLPSACMILWATLSALDYLAHGRRRDAVRMGLQAGYAFGLVLTGCLAALLWPALLLARPRTTRGAAGRHLLLAGGLALLVYVVTNPYVPYNALTGNAAFASNIGNSTAMYAGQMRQVLAGVGRVGTLLLEGLGPGVLLTALVGLGLLLKVRRRETLVVATPGLGILLMCVLLGAGKPAEFGRFLALPMLLLCVAAGVVLATLAQRRAIAGIVVTIVVLALLPGPAYVRALASDARGTHESRRQAGLLLSEQLQPTDALGVLQVPAPYAVPPADFTRRRIVLLPPQRPANIEPRQLPPWLVFTADDAYTHANAWWQAFYREEQRFPSPDTRLTPITWADKAVFVYRRVP